jgi:site-specific DNA recombinase
LVAGQGSGHNDHRFSGKPRHYVPYLLTGLITCGRCGFSFQGQSTTNRGKKYYRYVCGGYNAKRVCQYCAVGRDRLELFVIDSIEDALAENTLVERVERQIASLWSRQPIERVSSLQAVEAEILEINENVRRLVDAIAKGAPFESVDRKLKELDSKKIQLQHRHQSLREQDDRHNKVKSAAELVAGFSSRFREEFEAAPHHARKELVQRCLGKIIVDPDANVARCYIRRIPIVGGLTDEVIEKAEGAKGVPFSTIPLLRKVGVPGTGLEPARPRGH